MTDPDDKPSFLARLAVVVTFGVLALQIFGGMVAWFGKENPDSLDFRAGSILVGIFPNLTFGAIAGIYYLFKGKPTNADIVVKSRVMWIWFISAFGGIVFYIFMKAG